MSFAKININTATIDELSLLHGIGERKAEAIVAYRKAHGRFHSVKELSHVKGLGEKTVARLKRHLTLSGKSNVSDLVDGGVKADRKKSDKKAVSSRKKRKKQNKRAGEKVKSSTLEKENKRKLLLEKKRNKKAAN